jgi:RNA polymerase sigma-70 factor (ECF subfamily)
METKEDSWGRALRAEREGDSTAYEGFLRDFATSLRRIVDAQLRRMRFSPAETEDIVQEVLIAVHARRGQWDERRPLLPWLNAITRYKIIDASRRLRRDMRARIDLTDEEWSIMFTSEAIDFDCNRTDVERLVSELPTGEQAAVRAVGLEGVSIREAATRLGSSEGAIRVAFHRSLKKLMAAAQKRF